MQLENLLYEINKLKDALQQYRHLQSDKVTRALEVEYTYESNRIEGNTLTLQETALVIEKGLTNRWQITAGIFRSHQPYACFRPCKRISAGQNSFYRNHFAKHP
jgi:Fic family protein